MGLSKKQEQVWRFVSQYINLHGRSPTLEEIADGVDLRSVSTIHRHLVNLQNLGMIAKIPHGKRAVKITGQKISNLTPPLYSAYEITTGNKAIAIYQEIPLMSDLPTPLVGLLIADKSYERYGINEGDWLILHGSEKIKNGAMVAIELVNGVVLIRIAREVDNRWLLESLDGKNQLEVSQIRVIGQVIRLVRKF